MQGLHKKLWQASERIEQLQKSLLEAAASFKTLNFQLANIGGKTISFVEKHDPETFTKKALLLDGRHIWKITF